ncbi:CGNR zinc finger domain-containing protein [Mycobacterium sp. AMU20-3851]|uniref:CGNR zinc finger domain-containing protein n=1 Tax=Mycobacterium sp. AMU20-3851 TaxID=3122055 RepID=UPI003754421B
MGESGTVWVDDHFVGGHVALDFCNTVYRRTPVLGAELLDSPAAFTQWLDRVALAPESAGLVDKAALDDARRLRSGLWHAFDAQRAGERVPHGVLTGVLSHAYRHSEYVDVDQHGTVTATHLAGATSALAVAALQLLLHPPEPKVRACDGCGWLFIDTSRGRRRRWCSMKTCGNVHKVARHRAGLTKH